MRDENQVIMDITISENNRMNGLTNEHEEKELKISENALER